MEQTQLTKLIEEIKETHRRLDKLIARVQKEHGLKVCIDTGCYGDNNVVILVEPCDKQERHATIFNERCRRRKEEERRHWEAFINVIQDAINSAILFSR